jgi:hypothetical protein
MDPSSQAHVHNIAVRWLHGCSIGAASAAASACGRGQVPQVAGVKGPQAGAAVQHRASFRERPVAGCAWSSSHVDAVAWMLRERILDEMLTRLALVLGSAYCCGFSPHRRLDHAVGAIRVVLFCDTASGGTAAVLEMLGRADTPALLRDSTLRLTLVTKLTTCRSAALKGSTLTTPPGLVSPESLSSQHPHRAPHRAHTGHLKGGRMSE